MQVNESSEAITKAGELIDRGPPEVSSFLCIENVLTEDCLSEVYDHIGKLVLELEPVLI